MRFDVFTLFPEVMSPYLKASVLGNAMESGKIEVRLHNPRDYTTDRHRTTDDLPYGGGGGMVMKPEPIFAAVEGVLGAELEGVPVILMTPQGRVFNQALAFELSKRPRLAMICGRYEGIDERVREHLATDEISVGDYVLTGGELPALVVIDAVARLLAGVLGDEAASQKDSHRTGLLEHPHYTRPVEFRGWEVPKVLRSGDHKRVSEWRRRQSLLRTATRRPDLIAQAEIAPADWEWLESEMKNEGVQDESETID
jgi:tRNA (guanine37-N1)-methyltransferase